MSNDNIDWGQNCLTKGVHNGRDGALWGIPLGYAVSIFEAEALQELVVVRIYSDAMQMVRHGEGFTMEWAAAVKHYAELMYQHTLQSKIDELSKYYATQGWKSEQRLTLRLVTVSKLSVHYEPLHSHDTINLLCRIIGVGAEHKAAAEGVRG